MNNLQRDIFTKYIAKTLLLGSFFWLVMACQGEQVQLAQLDKPEILELDDHSPVYLFFRTVEIDTLVEVNRKNTIASTNWIFHIDKRFQLKQIVDEIHKLQNKKDNSSYKRADSGNYFSFMDREKKQLNFFDFTKIKYSYPNYYSTNYIKENPDYHVHFENFSIDFKGVNQLSINGFDMPVDEMASYIKETLLMTNSTKKALIYLNFNNNLSFEKYLYFWQKVKRFDASLIELSNVHFFYDEELIADCGCR